jgi:hypothetical protein
VAFAVAGAMSVAPYEIVAVNVPSLLLVVEDTTAPARSLEITTVDPAPVVTVFPNASNNCTVTVDVEVPFAGTDVGVAVIVDVAADAGPAVNTIVAGDPLTIPFAPILATITYDPAFVDVSVIAH